MSSRPVRLFRPLVVAVAGFALLASAGSARADVISYSGNTNSLPATTAGYDPVSFSGTVTVNGSGTTSATVSVLLTNTTSIGDAVQYGYITGFGFNLPGTAQVASAPGTTDADFKFLTAAANTTSLQAGEFDYAFSTSASQLHTVTNAQIPIGLAAGQSATFTFTVTRTGGGTVNLTAAQIITDTSGSGVPFSVRFRSTNFPLYGGHTDPDGDKVPATVTANPPTNPVPAPPGLVLAGMGFGCLLLGRLRRR